MTAAIPTLRQATTVSAACTIFTVLLSACSHGNAKVEETTPVDTIGVNIYSAACFLDYGANYFQAQADALTVRLSSPLKFAETSKQPLHVFLRDTFTAIFDMDV